MKKIICALIVIISMATMLLTYLYTNKNKAPEVIDTNSKIRELTKGKSSLIFNLVTDTHYTPLNSSETNIINLIENMKAIKSVDGVIHLGDIVNAYDCDVKDTVKAANLFKSQFKYKSKLYFVLGNHEGSRISFNEYSNTLNSFNRRYVKRNEDSLYYYFDNKETNTRSIVLQTYDVFNEEGYFGITNEQFYWLQEVALDTNYDVIIFGHIPINGFKIEDANTLSSLIEEYNNTHENKILIYIAGHTHEDRIDSTSYSIPIITIDDGASGNFDTMLYIPDLSIFYFIRTGVGEDREVIVINSICKN